MKAQQTTMFQTGEDLPLFSGTVPSVTIKRTPAIRTHSSQASFARCRLCLDTGRVGHKYCWCQAGQSARTAGRSL